MSIQITPLTLAWYPEVMALWKGMPGIGLSSADEPEAIARYLARNPDMSFIALDGDSLVGAVLCGHDGRRGFIHHMAVRNSHRGQGIGKVLANACLAALEREGVNKCHLFVYSGNTEAQVFWERLGWSRRADLLVMSTLTEVEEYEGLK